jgi:hypothetical protein
MPSYPQAGLALGLLFVVVFLTIAVYHAVFVGPRLRAIAKTLRGEADVSDGESLARLRFALEALERRSGQRLDALEKIVRSELVKVGFIRFNAFSDVGSDLSYALALLNEDGDGVVLTSIYSREETRTYGKSVRAFVASRDASKEEQTAISLTRQPVGVGVG